MIKLDKKDRDLLYELSKDCRIPYTKLAKKVGLSREVVQYRVNKLIKNKIITDFNTYISIEALKFSKYVLYLELKGVDKEKEDQIQNFLKKHEFIGWSATSNGKWSFICDIYAYNTEHMFEILGKIKKYLGEALGEYSLIPQRDFRYFYSKFFGPEPKSKEHNQNYKLDKTDLLVLKTLSNNARISLIELAKIIGLTPEALSSRIKKLKNNGVIKQFFAYCDLSLFGIQHYNIPIKLDNANEKIEDKFLKYLIEHPKVSFYYRPMAYWDFEFGVFVKTPKELRDFMRDIRTKFPENVRIFDMSLFYNEFKSNFIPEGVFDYLIKKLE